MIFADFALDSKPIFKNLLQVFFSKFAGELFAGQRFNPFSAETDFRRQILTSKVGPRTERIKNIIRSRGHRPIT